MTKFALNRGPHESGFSFFQRMQVMSIHVVVLCLHCMAITQMGNWISMMMYASVLPIILALFAIGGERCVEDTIYARIMTATHSVVLCIFSIEAWQSYSYQPADLSVPIVIAAIVYAATLNRVAVHWIRHAHAKHRAATAPLPME